ncbi:MAG: alpha/beta hydrolase [Chloroflexi bacterium]|nr:alpha/beta hydrolase [Chloroflexota bacterium]
MEQVLSKDGTSIAVQRSGTGPPLVMVHGTLASHQSWAGVLPALEQQFTVYALDRRGYGESGDGPSYAIEREFEDIASVVDFVGEGVGLFGHSFGGPCVLEAARLTPNVRRVVVYEPSPLPVPGAPLYPAGTVEKIEALLESGDREAVVLAVFRDLLDVPPGELDAYRASPRFPAWMAAAHLVPRETRAEEAYAFEPERFKDLRLPVLLLTGGDSPERLKTTILTWHAALANSRIVVLPGQGHIAHYTAPDLFIRELEDFLLETD